MSDMQTIRETEFAKRVRECREKQTLRQSDCAHILGVSRQMWNNWEVGYCKPKGKRMDALAKVLKCDSVWLRHGDSSEIEERIENVTRLLRIIVREMDHINKALGKS